MSGFTSVWFYTDRSLQIPETFDMYPRTADRTQLLHFPSACDPYPKCSMLLCSLTHGLIVGRCLSTHSTISTMMTVSTRVLAPGMKQATRKMSSIKQVRLYMCRVGSTLRPSGSQNANTGIRQPGEFVQNNCCITMWWVRCRGLHSSPYQSRGADKCTREQELGYSTLQTENRTRRALVV